MPTKKRLSVDNRQPHGTTHRLAVDWEALLARIPGGKTVVHYEADTHRNIRYEPDLVDQL